MNIERELEIKAAIYEVGLLFNQQPSDDRINAYAKALQNYTPKQITYAFNKVILSGTAFFPSLAELLAHLRPKDMNAKDLGNEISNEVIQKVMEFGIYRIQEAFAALSEEAKTAIGNNTYILSDVANSDRDQLPTLRAQLRDMAAAAVERNRQTSRNKTLESIGITKGQVLDFPKQEMRTMDYSNFLPESNGTEN